MAYDKVIDSSVLDASLTTVANAIRTASGSSGAMAFPDGFVSTLQNVKMIAEVHTVTLASDVTGAVEQTLLSGNTFIKKNYANDWFGVLMYADSPTAATGAVSFEYHGNRNFGAGRYGIGYRFTSASAIGAQPLTAKISGEGWGQHMRVRNTGNLTLYLSANQILKTGTYTIILICVEE